MDDTAVLCKECSFARTEVPPLAERKYLFGDGSQAWLKSETMMDNSVLRPRVTGVVCDLCQHAFTNPYDPHTPSSRVQLEPADRVFGLTHPITCDTCTNRHPQSVSDLRQDWRVQASRFWEDGAPLYSVKGAGANGTSNGTAQ
ncbi:hypothetical protein IAU59_005464 [Kwoniella sp. CBS 9459]